MFAMNHDDGKDIDLTHSNDILGVHDVAELEEITGEPLGIQGIERGAGDSVEPQGKQDIDDSAQTESEADDSAEPHGVWGTDDSDEADNSAEQQRVQGTDDSAEP